MHTVIEKVIFLQNVEVFFEVPTEQLAYLAAIAEEISCIKGDDIFKAEEPSDAMYLVLDGKVRLHREEEEVTVAGQNEAFGTWALFDEEPRVVTATAIEDTRLLRIYTEDFYGGHFSREGNEAVGACLSKKLTELFTSELGK